MDSKIGDIPGRENGDASVSTSAKQNGTAHSSTKAEEGQESGRKSKTMTCVTCPCVKKVILCVVLIAVWILLSLPIIFYHPIGTIGAKVYLYSYRILIIYMAVHGMQIIHSVFGLSIKFYRK